MILQNFFNFLHGILIHYAVFPGFSGEEKKKKSIKYERKEKILASNFLSYVSSQVFKENKRKLRSIKYSIYLKI